MASRNWIKEIVDERAAAERAAAAREELLKLRELKAMTEGGTTGGTMATETGLAVNIPELFGVKEQAALPIVTKDAGYDPANIAQAELRGIQATGAQYDADKKRYEAEDSRRRTEAVGRVLDDPTIDSLLAADVAQKKEVAEPGRLVKVRDRSGKDVYYRERRRGVSDQFDYVPATDAGARPLQIPPGEGGGGGEETSEQRNIRNRARIIRRMNPNMTEAEAEIAAYQQIAALKGKAPEEAWAQLVTSLSSAQYGRYSRDPQKLRAQAELVWSVARPGEPIPETPPPPVIPAAAAAAVPPPGAIAPPPRPQPAPTAVNPQTGQRLIFKDGAWRPM